MLKLKKRGTGKAISISLVFITLLLLSNCSDKLTDTSDNKKKISSAEIIDFNQPIVKNGALVFNTGQDLGEFINKLQLQPVEKVENFMSKQVNSFTSLKEAQFQVKHRKSKSVAADKKVLNLKIPDPTFASILNKNGVVQIGETVYKITNKYTYIFKNRAAYESFDFPRIDEKLNKSFQYYIKPCVPEVNRIKKLQENVYRATNCGGGGYGGGGGSDDDNEIPPDELDPHDKPNVDFPAEKSEYYRSGGNQGRLRGKTWNVNYVVYSSFGTKSKHERHTWLRWWDRTADYITLDSYVQYTYRETKIPFHTIEVGLKFNYGNFMVEAVDKFLFDIQNMKKIYIGKSFSRSNIEFSSRIYHT